MRKFAYSLIACVASVFVAQSFAQPRDLFAEFEAEAEAAQSSAAVQAAPSSSSVAAKPATRSIVLNSCLINKIVFSLFFLFAPGGGTTHPPGNHYY